DHFELRTNVRQVIEEILPPSTWLNAASRENNSFQTRNERIRRRDNILQLVTKRESGHVGWKTQPRDPSLLDTGKDHGCPGPKLVAQPQRIPQLPRGVGYDDADSLIAILFTEVRPQDIEIVCRSIRINSQILDKDKWRVRGFRLNGGVKGLAHLAKPRIYRSILIEEQNGARQRLRSRRDRRQGHRQTEHDTHHNAMWSATRLSRRSLHDDHRPIFCLARNVQRNGTHGINLFRFAAVHMIPPGSQLDPFYLLGQKAPNADERGCEGVPPCQTDQLRLLSNRALTIRLSEPFPDNGSRHPLRMAFGADTPHRWLQLLIPAPALHARLS